MKFDNETCMKNIKSFMVRQKILEKKSDNGSQEVTVNDIFMVNEKFSSMVKKIALPQPFIEEVYKKGKFDYS